MSCLGRSNSWSIVFTLEISQSPRVILANAPNCSPPFTESALGCTFALASDQASKLGLKKNKSIVGIYGSYQLVQFNHASLITTFVANSSANTGKPDHHPRYPPH
ncbi:unnamed protein product [Mortierella alpina]